MTSEGATRRHPDKTAPKAALEKAAPLQSPYEVCSQWGIPKINVDWSENIRWKIEAHWLQRRRMAVQSAFRTRSVRSDLTLTTQISLLRTFGKPNILECSKLRNPLKRVFEISFRFWTFLCGGLARRDSCTSSRYKFWAPALWIYRFSRSELCEAIFRIFCILGSFLPKSIRDGWEKRFERPLRRKFNYVAITMLRTVSKGKIGGHTFPISLIKEVWKLRIKRSLGKNILSFQQGFKKSTRENCGNKIRKGLNLNLNLDTLNLTRTSFVRYRLRSSEFRPAYSCLGRKRNFPVFAADVF